MLLFFKREESEQKENIQWAHHNCLALSRATLDDWQLLHTQQFAIVSDQAAWLPSAGSENLPPWKKLLTNLQKEMKPYNFQVQEYFFFLFSSLKETF